MNDNTPTGGSEDGGPGNPPNEQAGGGAENGPDNTPDNTPDNVIEFPGITTLPVDPERVLKGASGKLKAVVVIGYDANDDVYFASSEPDGAEVVWLLEYVKHQLMSYAIAEDQRRPPPSPPTKGA